MGSRGRSLPFLGSSEPREGKVLYSFFEELQQVSAMVPIQSIIFFKFL